MCEEILDCELGCSDPLDAVRPRLLAVRADPFQRERQLREGDGGEIDFGAVSEEEAKEADEVLLGFEVMAARPHSIGRCGEQQCWSLREQPVRQLPVL